MNYSYFTIKLEDKEYSINYYYIVKMISISTSLTHCGTPEILDMEELFLSDKYSEEFKNIIKRYIDLSIFHEI